MGLNEKQRLALVCTIHGIERYNNRMKKDFLNGFLPETEEEGCFSLYEQNKETLRATSEIDAAAFGVQIPQQDFLDWYEINAADFRRYNQELADFASKHPEFCIEKELVNDIAASLCSGADLILEDVEDVEDGKSDERELLDEALLIIRIQNEAKEPMYQSLKTHPAKYRITIKALTLILSITELGKEVRAGSIMKWFWEHADEIKVYNKKLVRSQGKRVSDKVDEDLSPLVYLWVNMYRRSVSYPDLGRMEDVNFS